MFNITHTFLRASLKKKTIFSESETLIKISSRYFNMQNDQARRSDVCCVSSIYSCSEAVPTPGKIPTGTNLFMIEQWARVEQKLITIVPLLMTSYLIGIMKSCNCGKMK